MSTILQKKKAGPIKYVMSNLASDSRSKTHSEVTYGKEFIPTIKFAKISQIFRVKEIEKWGKKWRSTHFLTPSPMLRSHCKNKRYF